MSTKLARKPVLLSTLVFLDLETTGLPRANFKPEITELCMLATSRFSVEETDKPLRVQNKLNLCFCPTRTTQPVAAKVSGLNEDNLFHQKDFDTTAAKLIQLFITRLDPPICLIAHNGIRFDFPLLRSHLLGVCGSDFRLLDCNKSPILCADSLPMFQSLSSYFTPDNSLGDSGFDSLDTPSMEQPASSDALPLAESSPKKASKNVFKSKPSFHLGDLHLRVFGARHANAHNAEGDCIAVLNLLRHVAMPAIDWMQVNYVGFDEIRPMFIPPSTPLTNPDEFPYNKPDQSMSTNDTNETVPGLSDLRLS